MNVKCKIWFEQDDGVAFSEGRKMLLEAVDQLGSLNAAAKKLGMSYRAAWGKIKATERVLGVRLLEVTTGGKGGGGSVITTEAKELISGYQKYNDKVSALVEKEFKRFYENKKWLLRK